MNLSAHDITLTLKEQEVQALLGLIDAAVKSQGLSAVINAAVLFQKIQLAVKQQSTQQLPEKSPTNL
jgi:hypothetical protein